MGSTELCCCCLKEMKQPSEHNYTYFRYEVPGLSEGERTLVAVVCTICHEESEKKEVFPVIEALINARIIRDQHPEMLFTPKSW